MLQEAVAATLEGCRVAAEVAVMMESPHSSEYNDGWVNASRGRRHDNGGSLRRRNGSSNDGITAYQRVQQRLG